MILVPVAFVIIGLVAATCVLAVADLKARQRDAERAWQRLEELRERGLAAVPAFVAAVSRDQQAASAKDGSSHADESSALGRALDDVKSAARKAAVQTNPSAAAAADDRLVQAVERVYAAAEIDPSFVASAASRRASARLDDAEHALAHEQQIYNNAAVIAQNTQRSFPALLFVKRLGLQPPERYESEAAARRAAHDWTRESLPSLADASPHVMNPQMLWASSMADFTLNDRTDDRKQPRS